MKYVYPAILTPLPSGEYDVLVPDLPSCITCGKDLADAIEVAQDAIKMWLCDAEDNQESLLFLHLAHSISTKRPNRSSKERAEKEEYCSCYR